MQVLLKYLVLSFVLLKSTKPYLLQQIQFAESMQPFLKPIKIGASQIKIHSNPISFFLYLPVVHYAELSAFNFALFVDCIRCTVSCFQHFFYLHACYR